MWRDLGREGEPPAGLLDRLLTAYGASHRAYHTRDHLLECLNLAEEYRRLAERVGEVEAALWFHDVVYDPTRHDNEQRSAELAAAALQEEGVAPEVVSRIAEAVLATDHGAPQEWSGDAALVHDIDLAVLGAEEDRFREYQQQIRREFGWVLHSVYRAERQMLLRGFLGRPRIYLTDALCARFEERARANLTAALP